MLYHLEINVAIIELLVDLVMKQEEGVQITANSLHPGAIQTNIVRFDNGILHCKLHLLHFTSVNNSLVKSLPKRLYTISF
jgi:hypothetical protein